MLCIVAIVAVYTHSNTCYVLLLLLLYTTHIATHAMYCCYCCYTLHTYQYTLCIVAIVAVHYTHINTCYYCRLYPCTPCHPLQNNQNIPYLVAMADCPCRVSYSLHKGLGNIAQENIEDILVEEQLRSPLHMGTVDQQRELNQLNS